MTAAADRFTLSLLLSAASDLGARALTTSLREGCARFGRQGTHRQVTRQESFSSSFQQAFTLSRQNTPHYRGSNEDIVSASGALNQAYQR